MMIKKIENITEKYVTVRTILKTLPEWFGIPESREKYITDSTEQIVFAAYYNDKPMGFLALKPTSHYTVEIASMGVLKEYHRQGIGTKLFIAAKEYAKSCGYDFMQVKTVKFGCYGVYDKTNLFYQHLGFKEFEVLPELWDLSNPCQIYVINI